jgi:hypothetical protein
VDDYIGQQQNRACSVALGDIYAGDARAGGVSASLGNWARIGNAVPAAQTAPTGVIVAAVLLTAKITGIFLASVTLGWSDSAGGDSPAIVLSTFTATAGTVTGGVASGFVGTNAAAGSGGFIENTNVTSLVVLGGAGAVTQDSKSGASLAGLLTANGSGSMNYSFMGIVANSATVKTPFTIGNKVGLAIALTIPGASTQNFTTTSVSMTLLELPFG